MAVLCPMAEYGANIQAPTDVNYPSDADLTFPRSVVNPMQFGDPLPNGLMVVRGVVNDPESDPVGAGYAVRVYDQVTGVLVGQTETDAQGEFEVTRLSTAPVFVVAVDKDNTWKAPVVDRVTPFEPT